MKAETYYVLSISTHANTFGYFGVILLSASGHGVEAKYSPYAGGLPKDQLENGLPKRGTRVQDLFQHGFVSARDQGYMRPAAAKRIIQATLQREEQTA
jgi:hypothetical protein